MRRPCETKKTNMGGRRISSYREAFDNLRLVIYNGVSTYKKKKKLIHDSAAGRQVSHLQFENPTGEVDSNFLCSKSVNNSLDTWERHLSRMLTLFMTASYISLSLSLKRGRWSCLQPKIATAIQKLLLMQGRESKCKQLLQKPPQGQQVHYMQREGQ